MIVPKSLVLFYKPPQPTAGSDSLVILRLGVDRRNEIIRQKKNNVYLVQKKNLKKIKNKK